MMGIDVSIIVVSWNTADILGSALDSVSPACEGLVREVVVVDNASADNSVELLRERGDIRLICADRNTGFTRAANLGARQSGGRYILFLNPDLLLSPGSVSLLVRALDTDPAAWAATPWFRNPDGTPQWFWRRLPTAASAGLCFTHRGRRLDRLFGGLAMRRHHYRELHDPPPTIPIEAVGAACLLVRRSDFEAVGGFDERYFNFFQDTHLARQMRRAGRVLVGLGPVEVVHQLGVTFRRLRPTDAHGQLLYGLRQYLAGEPWIRRLAGELAVWLEVAGPGSERAHLRSVALAPLNHRHVDGSL
ncbi:MAG: glycosyltransferase family 2 protein [Acidimicrobiales bacterium]